MPEKLSFLLGVAGAVSLLLWGSYMVRAGVEKAYAARISGFISRASASKLKSFLCGMVSAIVLQSATATVMLTTTFVSSGMVGLTAAIVVIIGADLGSALAVRILFLDLSFVSPALLLAGLGFHRFSRTWQQKQLARVLVGLGLILLSIQLLKQLTLPLANEPLSEQLVFLLNSQSWIGLVLATLAAWLAHSSVAVVLIVATMAEVGVIDPPLFIALVLGANIGSGIIPLLLVSKNFNDAYAAVLANFAMRLFLALILFFSLAWILQHIDRLGGSGGSQVVTAHIIFNLLLGLIFVPLSKWVSKIVQYLLKSNPADSLAPSFQSPGSSLDYELVNKPKQALSCATREAFRLADNTEAMFAKALDMFLVDDRLGIDQLIAWDKNINIGNKAIQKYLSEVRRHVQPEKNNFETELDNILRFSTTMENIGDIVSYNLSRLAIKRQQRGVTFSSEGLDELSSIHGEVLRLIRLEITRFGVAEETGKKKKKNLVDSINQMGQQSIVNHRLRLSNRQSNSLDTSSIHQDAVRDLLQVVNLVSHIELA